MTGGQASSWQPSDSTLLALLEAAPDAMVVVDHEGRIVLTNAQTERLFGYSREELIGESVEILVPDQARNLHVKQRGAYHTNPVSRPMGIGTELAGRRKDGTVFPAEVSLSAIDTETGVLISSAIRDLTERLEAQAERERLRAEAQRQKLERQLHQSQRLESLGQLAGGVAHDFNNLLGAIINYASFVAGDIEQRAGERLEDWRSVLDDVAEIQHAAERASRLTHQLLTFGRREVVQPAVLSLNHIVRDIERLLARTLGEHVELIVNLADDVWTVMVDPGQVEQILVNLAVNARDAMPTGGKLVIETENVLVDAHYLARRPGLTTGRYVRLRVSDTGHGMERDVLDHVFEPFFTTKPKGEGSGLGLATVYGIVKQADGDIDIYSEPGLGTTISVMMPASDQPPAAAAETSRREPYGGGATVLVVEDEPAMREVTRRILTRNGYDVIVAGSGDEALAAAAEHSGPIDLLLTDVVMPKMLGKEVADRVTELRPDVRVLYMSGYAQPVLASQGTLDPGVTLVEKPFTESMLLDKVRERLDGPPRSSSNQT